MSVSEQGDHKEFGETDDLFVGDIPDSVASTLRMVTRERLLTPEEEKELADAARNGDNDARRRLVEANMRLVVSIARRYYCPDVPFEDLVQEGAIGLMTAVEHFDPSLGFRFSTYATHWIRQAISRAIVAKSRAVRVPAYVCDMVKRIERCRMELIRELGHPPPLETLARRSGIPVDRILAYMRATQGALSLDAIAGHEDRTLFWGVAGHDSIRDPEEEVLDRELQREIEAILNSLSERERLVMRRRFGFEGDDTQALQDIGQEFGISRERVRQIEARALRRLRAVARRRRLHEYLRD